MTASFEKLIRDAARPDQPPDVWWVVGMLVRAKKLRGEERTLAIITVANCLVRQKRLLDMAGDLLEDVARTSGPRHVALMTQALLAECRGEIEKAKALRLLASEAPDAPTAAETLGAEWAAQEVNWRKRDPSQEGKRARLDALFNAQRTLTSRRAR